MQHNAILISIFISFLFIIAYPLYAADGPLCPILRSVPINYEATQMVEVPLPEPSVAMETAPPVLSPTRLLRQIRIKMTCSQPPESPEWSSPNPAIKWDRGDGDEVIVMPLFPVELERQLNNGRMSIFIDDTIDICWRPNANMRFICEFSHVVHNVRGNLFVRFWEDPITPELPTPPKPETDVLE